jgi:hypothetical protein
MRRLTLILSDLYHPMAEGSELAAGGSIAAAALDLPHLDWLLRFAQRPVQIRDWRSWLSADLGAARLAELSVAHGCALGILEAALARDAWLATPVHLEARLDHVRLSDRGLLRMDAGERETWRQEFARSFGPEYALHDAGDSFLLSGVSPARVASVDPARLLDSDIGSALPTGPAAGELRRLGTEIEMWLHSAAANAARERARLRRVSALWLWGGGAGNAALAPGEEAPCIEGVAIHGRDPYLNTLARRAPPLLAVPDSFEGLGDILNGVVVELTPMCGAPEQSLDRLDACWFAPVRAALNRGQLDRVDVVANDRWFRIAGRSGWRFWRRRSPWLAQLARKA